MNRDWLKYLEIEANIEMAISSEESIEGSETSRGVYHRLLSLVTLTKAVEAERKTRRDALLRPRASQPASVRPFAPLTKKRQWGRFGGKDKFLVRCRDRREPVAGRPLARVSVCPFAFDFARPWP